MPSPKRMTAVFALSAILALPVLCWGQSFNASISGTVTDPSGAAVPEAQLTLTAVATGAVAKATSGPDGLFAFPNLQRGAYELKVTAKGFRDFLQRGISVSINESVRLDVKLDLGAAIQTVEVTANASPLNYYTSEIKQAITAAQITALPLLAAGAKRSAVGFFGWLEYPPVSEPARISAKKLKPEPLCPPKGRSAPMGGP